jgi:hypothetical protein
MTDSPLGTRPPALRRWLGFGMAALLAGVLVMGCEDGTSPSGTSFGRIGTVRVTVDGPLADSAGRLLQTISWSSDGRWTLTESIFYKDSLGDATVSRSTEDSGVLAQRYASWIASVNDSTTALGIFLKNLPSDTVPICNPRGSIAVARSTVTVTILDSHQGDSIAWTRCAQGTLGTLASDESRGGPGASRVVEAARLVRNFTVSAKGDFSPAYIGSIPVRPILRGDNNALLTPREIDDAQTWSTFWKTYISTTAPLPSVDFAHEVVLIGAIGMRQEVGDSVEVRSIRRVAYGTQVNLAEQRLGDFCTPATRPHAPFHIVAAPTGQESGAFKPIYFSVGDPAEKIPCG